MSTISRTPNHASKALDSGRCKKLHLILPCGAGVTVTPFTSVRLREVRSLARGLGLPDLENTKAGCPVKFAFQIDDDDKESFSICMSQIVPGTQRLPGNPVRVLWPDRAGSRVYLTQSPCSLSCSSQPSKIGRTRLRWAVICILRRKTTDDHSPSTSPPKSHKLSMGHEPLYGKPLLLEGL